MATVSTTTVTTATGGKLGLGGGGAVKSSVLPQGAAVVAPASTGIKLAAIKSLLTAKSVAVTATAATTAAAYPLVILGAAVTTGALVWRAVTLKEKEKTVKGERFYQTNSSVRPMPTGT